MQNPLQIYGRLLYFCNIICMSALNVTAYKIMIYLHINNKELNWIIIIIIINISVQIFK
jgi:hypothetical protein